MEIALLGIHPTGLNILTEILKSHGFSCRAFAARDEIGIWLKSEGKACPLVIADGGSEGLFSKEMEKIRISFPRSRVLPIPPHLKPSELFRLIETALQEIDGGEGRFLK